MPDAPQIQQSATQVPATTTRKLAQLHALYAERKAAADEATKQLKAVTDAIKIELTTAAPGQTRIELVGKNGPPLGLSYVETWRLDSTRLKREQPETYVLYAKQSGSWRLAVLGPDGDE